MANKLLNTLTLDGTSFDIFNDRFPHETIEAPVSAFNVPNNVQTDKTIYTVTVKFATDKALGGTTSYINSTITAIRLPSTPRP